MNLLQQAIELLKESNTIRRHPFRLFQLATIGVTYPEIRTVVNRGFTDKHQLICYTDSRSPKTEQISANSKVSALFYHSDIQLQIRIKGQVEIIDKTHIEYDFYFKKASQYSLKDYQSKAAPSSIIHLDTTSGFGLNVHFAILRITIQQFDILKLGKEKHERALFTLHESNYIYKKLIP